MSEIRWFDRFEDARSHARKVKKTVFIDFWDPG